MASKLIIKDLDLFDSGVYKLYTNNHFYEKHIYISLLVKSKIFKIYRLVKNYFSLCF